MASAVCQCCHTARSPHQCVQSGVVFVARDLYLQHHHQHHHHHHQHHCLGASGSAATTDEALASPSLPAQRGTPHLRRSETSE